MPLEPEEKKDYRVRDSIFEVQKDSAMSKSSIDTLKKQQGKLKPLSIFWKGYHRTHYSKNNTYDWGIESLVKGLEYNTIEGVVVNVNAYVEKYIKKIKTNCNTGPV